MNDVERIATLEQWKTDTESQISGIYKIIKVHDERCEELDTFKTKWVFGIIMMGIFAGSLGTFLISNSEWLFDSIPVPNHYHNHKHDVNGDMILGEGVWGND